MQSLCRDKADLSISWHLSNSSMATACVSNPKRRKEKKKAFHGQNLVFNFLMNNATAAGWNLAFCPNHRVSVIRIPAVSFPRSPAPTGRYLTIQYTKLKWRLNRAQNLRLVAAFEPDHYDILGQRVGKQIGIEKCQSVKLSEKKKKKRMSETICFYSSLKMTQFMIQYKNHFTHQRSIKAFQMEWQQLISRSGANTVSFITWSRVSGVDLDHEILLVAQKFFSRAKLMG